MNTVLLVARREISVRGRTKGFRYGLLVTAVLIGVLASLPKILGGPSEYVVGLSGPSAERMAEALSAQVSQRDDTTMRFERYPDETAARAAVQDGKVEAAVTGDKVISKSVLDGDLSVMLDTAHRVVATEAGLVSAGLDPAKVQQAQQVTPLTPVMLNGTGEEAGVRLVFAMTMVVILFMLLMQICTWVAMGVVEEKGSRIVEILLTAVRPWQLLTGKTLGLGVLGLAQLLVIAVVGLGAAQVTGAVPDMPAGMYGVVANAVLWFLLGYVFYAAMFAAIASTVSRQEELSGVLTPATMLLMASYLIGFFAARTPEAPLTRVLSIVPPFSGMVMPVRTAVMAVPVWETALAMGLMVVAAAAVLALGGKVYQRAVLRTGARVRLRDLFGTAA